MSPPNSTTVPGAPSTPAPAGGPVVTSGGTPSSRVHHIRYSALAQYRYGGPHRPGPAHPACWAFGAHGITWGEAVGWPAGAGAAVGESGHVSQLAARPSAG